MDDVKTLLAVAGGIIAVVVALVGVGRSYYRNQELVERADILQQNRDLQSKLHDEERAREEEIRALQAKLSACEAQRDQLNDQITVIGRAGGCCTHAQSGH